MEADIFHDGATNSTPPSARRNGLSRHRDAVFPASAGRPDPSVSAVIVHFMGRAYLDRCVAACLAIPRIAEVLIIDNEGIGGVLRERYPDRRVRVVQMSRNVGYGGAANVGLDLATSPTVLLLNQDAVPTEESLAAMLDTARRSGASIVGVPLVNGAGVDHPLAAFFPFPLAWRAPDATPEASFEYRAWVCGAVLLFPPGFTHLRFDPGYFMYVEEADLCWRVWASGGSVALAKDGTMEHEGGTSTRLVWSERTIRWLGRRNQARFVWIHAGPGGMVPLISWKLWRGLARTLNLPAIRPPEGLGERLRPAAWWSPRAADSAPSSFQATALRAIASEALGEDELEWEFGDEFELDAAGEGESAVL